MAHFALQKLHILPSVFANMPEKEKIFIYGSTQVRIDQEKTEASKIKAAKGKRGGRRR